MTDCNTELAIDDVSPGATVRVFGNGVLVANALAPNSPSAIVPLFKPLTPGTQLTARQDRPTDPGFDSPVQLTVNAAPDPPPPPAIPHVVHRCSRCVTLSGMNAGHEARVLEQLVLLGSAKALRPPRQQVGASAPIDSSPVHAAAFGCKGPGISSTILPYSLPTLDEVPAPIVNGPIEDCATTIHLSGLVPGSLVTIFRTNELPLTTCVGAPSGTLRVPPLTAGQKVWAIARMDACAGSRTKPSRPSNEVIVSSDLPPPPSVLPPCPGTSKLCIGTLRPGATVVAHIRNEPYFKTVSGASTVLDLDIALVDGETITVRQALCPGKWGGVATVKVRESGGLLLPPQFESLLYEGATVVRMSRLLVGGRLELSSALGKGTLAVVEPTMGPMVDVFLPPLVAGDTIIATFTRCDQTTSNARGVVKTRRDKLPVPIIVEASTCGYVQVTNVLPGAVVILFVNGKPVDTQLTPTVGVQFRRALAPTDVVQVAYQIAGATQFSAKVGVTATDPEGTWRVVGTFGVKGEEFLAVHAALLHTPPDPKDPLQRFGWRVLYFAGSQHDPRFHLIGEDKKKKNVDPTPPEWNNTRFFFSDKGSTTGYNHTVVPSELPYDVFCAGHAFLGDGNLLVAGGSGEYIPRDPNAPPDEHPGHYLGVKDSVLFDAQIATWIPTGPLNDDPLGGADSGGRWYPTLTTLSTGDVVAIAGHPDGGSRKVGNDQLHTNPFVEWFDINTRTWSVTNSLFVGWTVRTGTYLGYPRVFTMPTHQLAVFGTGQGAPSISNSEVAWSTEQDPTNGHLPYSIQNNILRPNELIGLDCALDSATLLPLDASDQFRTRVLYVSAHNLATDTYEPLIFDFGTRAQPSQNHSVALGIKHPIRVYGMLTLLANGATLLAGGLGKAGSTKDADAVTAAEMYEPSTAAWTSAGTAKVPRQYHATSLLLPDGNVAVAGSNINRQYSLNTPNVPSPLANVNENWDVAENREFLIEVFEPPYKCVSPRANITASSNKISYGSIFTIDCTNASLVLRVHLIRNGSFTHGFNFDQRCISLSFIPTSATKIGVTAPPDGWVAPPGYYMIFLVGTNGSVSELAWICWVGA